MSSEPHGTLLHMKNGVPLFLPGKASSCQSPFSYWGLWSGHPRERRPSQYWLFWKDPPSKSLKLKQRIISLWININRNKRVTQTLESHQGRSVTRVVAGSCRRCLHYPLYCCSAGYGHKWSGDTYRTATLSNGKREGYMAFGIHKTHLNKSKPFLHLERISM